MTYDPNIPQPADLISQSQAQLLSNFQSLNTLYGLEHFAFDAASTGGKHKFVTLPDQGSAPTTAANVGAVYAKSVSGATQLFWRGESSGAEQQITNPAIGATGTNYSILTALGLRFSFGRFVCNKASTAVSFQTAFASAVYACVLTTEADTGDNRGAVISNGTLTTSGFSGMSSKDGQICYYIAIGV